MDPNANLKEQRTLARDLVEFIDDVDIEVYDETIKSLAQQAGDLAERVLALDEWRESGGFDPYITASEVIERLYEDTYKPKMQALLQRVRDACGEAGLLTDDEPFDMSGDDYKWSLRVWPSQESKDAANDDDMVDVSVEIAESREYDGENEYGINFGIDIVKWGGEILGGLTPFNYSEKCWVDARDTEAVSARWQILEDADPNEIPPLIREER